MAKETDCHRILATRETLKSLFADLEKQLFETDSTYNLVVDEIPTFTAVYPYLGRETLNDPFEPYPTGPRPSLDDTNIFLHSSGSTGLPKSIKQTFRMMSEWAACRE